MSKPELKNENQSALKQENVNVNNHENPGPTQDSGDGGSGGGGGHGFGQFRGNRGGFGNRFQPNWNRQQNQGQGQENRDFHNKHTGGPRGRQGGPPRGQWDGQQQGSRNLDDRILEKLDALTGPMFDLPPLDTSEKKFSGKNRLYIGNISNEITEEDLTELFKNYGETGELFVNKEKNFGFIKLDFHSNAEKAKRELDGYMLKGRNLKIRFAPNASTIKVKNLTPFVSNELLYAAFSIFGEIERAVIIVDDRGKSTGEGIVEFARKGNALQALRKCNESCFFLTSSLRPAIVEAYEALDECDGLPEKSIHKRNADYFKEREVGPRFANSSSFEHEYGMRWKQLYELFAQKEAALKRELELTREKLEAQMDFARYEHDTEMLREQLRAREMDKDRQKREWEMRERQVEEARQRAEEMTRKQQEDLEANMSRQEEEMRRRQQENSMFMQAHQLDTMLNQQEQNFESPDRSGYNDAPIGGEGLPPVDPKTFMSSYERNNRFEGREMGRFGGNMGGRGRWVNEGRDDYPNKRRRF